MSREAKRAKSKHTEAALDLAVQALKKSGLKLTQARKAVLRVLVDNHGPFTAEEVHKLISKRACDQATVYRTLTSLENSGLLRRCQFGDGTARFEMAEAGHHHHHIVCNNCKRVDIVEDQEIEDIDRFARRAGYAEVSHIVEFFGICERCQALFPDAARR